MKIVELINKFNNSSKGKVIKSICLLIFSLALVTVVTCAWLVSNVSTTSGGMSMHVSGENSYAKYSAYYIQDIDTKDVIKGAQSNTNGSNNLEVGLREYDLTFTSVNEYAPIVIRIELYNIDEEFIPAAAETKHLNVVISRNAALDPGTNTKLAGVLSSVGQIDCYTSSSLSLSAADKTIYDTIISQYRADGAASTFTTVANNQISKVDELSINVAYTEDDLKTGDEGRDCLVVYMVIDYNPTLTALYAEQSSSQLSDMNDCDRQFTIDNDLSNIDVEFE